VPQRSSYAEGTPNWVDLQTTDVDSAKAFYSTVFGWTYDDMPMEQGGVYSLARLGGELVAAIAPQNPALAATGAPPAWNTYIAVSDVDTATARVVPAGGIVGMEPFDIEGGAGRMSFVLDPSGAAVGLWQAGTHIGATLVNEPGALTWNELTSADLDRAVGFYEEVVGVAARRMPMGDGEYTMLYVGEAMVGGATAPQAQGIPNHWHVWFAVADTDASVASAADAGGTVRMAPFDIPVGRVATLSDPQGAVFSIIRGGSPEG
jgi:uncharacterized protein